MAFTLPVDIANRACQHMGATRIATSDFSEVSVPATEIGACYDNLRDAELRRNSWVFAIRRSVLRALTTTTVVYTPPAYASGTTYAVGAIVTSGGSWWQSAVAGNIGHTPAIGSAYWTNYFGPDTADTFDATVSYFAGELAVYSGATYLSLINSNLGNTPPSAGNWLAVTGTNVTLQLLYPISTGPASDTTTNNVYRLPHGYLKRLPTNPRGSADTYLGAPHLSFRDDVIIENGYLITSLSGASLLRFVADVTDVSRFDPMFCEGLGARIAIETCERITQSSGKLADCRMAYKTTMGEARIANGIEQGSIDMVEDEFITCRL